MGVPSTLGISIGLSMSWNPFRQSKKLSDEDKLAFAQLAAEPLRTQMMLLDDRSVVSPEGTLNARAIGYVYGWTDAFLRVRGWDMADTTIGIAVLFHTLRLLWPGKENELIHYVVEHIRDSVLQAGMIHGGQQYLDWRNRKLLTPTGFAQCLLAPRLPRES
jgi:hypothetical protein